MTEEKKRDKETYDEDTKPLAESYRTTSAVNTKQAVQPSDQPLGLRGTTSDMGYQPSEQPLGMRSATSDMGYMNDQKSTSYGGTTLGMKSDTSVMGGKIGPIYAGADVVSDTVPSKSQELQIPEWTEGVDRFTNFLTNVEMRPEKLLEEVKTIFGEIKKDEKLSYSKSTEAFTFEPYLNYFMCKVIIDEYMNCEFSVGVYKHQNDKCLIDIQELSGEHLTFSQFLEDFKSGLGQHKLVDLPSFDENFMNNYGLDIEISLEAFK